MSKEETLELRYVPLSTVRRWDRNPKKHDMGALAASIERYGFKDPPAFDPSLNTGTGGIVEGNGRAECLTWMKSQKRSVPRGIVVQDDEWLIPVLFGVDAPSQAAAESYGVDHNNLTMAGGDFTALDMSRMWEGSEYTDILASLAEMDELPLTLDGDDLGLLLNIQENSETDPNATPTPEQAHSTLAERFIVPPFSVLDARQGYWQARKKAWIALGVQNELGREASGRNVTSGKNSAMHKLTGRLAGDVESGGSTTSQIDPVLCECLYRWFCPPQGHVINPTAGESGYGLVAAYLGYPYTGVELRAEQVEANRQQAAAMGVEAAWIEGDGRNTRGLVQTHADFIICCPPYADLEVYSDNPNDISTMEYVDFLEAYREIIKSALDVLLPDRFAAFIVGEVRDGKGIYRNFVGDTIQAFLDAGAKYYNEMILVTPAGSLPLRAGRLFSLARKVGKTHQNVLIFVKGDPKKATEACGEVDVSFPEGLEDA